MPNPYALIQDFFSALSLPRYRKYIFSTLKAAGSAHYWKKEDPASLLYFQKKMEDLLDAAHLLLKKPLGKKTERKKSVLRPESLAAAEIDQALYLDKSSGLSQWEAFPRSLSEKEFLNPRIAFEAFFRHRSLKEWKADFGEIIFYALTPHSCSEDLVDLDLLKTNRLLQKLIEAAHLIWVREGGSFRD
jgi:hypothetical protein